MLRTSIVVASLALAAPAAYADVCAWNSESVAKATQSALGTGTPLRFYCQPCGEKAATSAAVKEVAVEKIPDADNMYKVKVNGEEIDLAYTFVADGSGGWDNLGWKMRCGAEEDFVKKLPVGLAVK